MTQPPGKPVTVTVVTCPTCGREVAWTAGSPYKPFCSDRCRLIDLGAWADGSYSIAGEPAPVDDEAGESHGH